MKIFAFTKHNPKYARLRSLEEDTFRYEKRGNSLIVVVADGITRDPKGITVLPHLEDKRGIEEARKNYPNPSPAKRAADLFRDSFLDYFKKREASEEIIRESFAYANREIYKKLNVNLKVDYLENDFAGCVASGGVIQGDDVYYGFIADCGVCVFDSGGTLKLRTSNEGPGSKGSLSEEIKRKYNTSFTFPEGRKIIRSKYRNNLLEPLSYGALTGEEVALDYVKTGKVKIEPGDKLIFYSDGMAPLLYSEEFPKHFTNIEKFVDSHLRNIEGAEATLVGVLFTKPNNCRGPSKSQKINL